MFGFIFSPFYFLLPLIFFFIIVRAVFGFFRGVGRRRFDELPREFTLPGDAQRARAMLDRRNSSQESAIFKLAYRMKGRLTLSDIVVETGLSLAEAEDLIQGMVDTTHVRMEVDDRGMVVYEFPEILRRFEEE